MKIAQAIGPFAIIAVVACTNDAGVRTCIPKTLWLNFSCGNDLANTDGLQINLSRDDGANAEFITTLKCPGTHAFQVKMPNYTEGQTFVVAAVPTKSERPIGAANVLRNVRLMPECTAVAFPLGAQHDDDAAVSDEEAGSPTPTPDAGAPPCIAGTLACPCAANDQCSSGLSCEQSVCISLTCGNGLIDTGEACDRGDLNKDNAYGGCQTNCTLGPSCGDGVTNGSEDCDDANANDADLCSTHCVACDNRQGFKRCGVSCVQTDVCSCLANTDCATGSYCGGGICRPQAAAGADCKAANECSSGNCVDEVCCTVAACGSCQSCSLKGDGTCVSVAAGQQDPAKVCKDQGASSCGQNGLCSGTGSCQTYSCTCDGFDTPHPVSSGLANPASYDTSVAGIVTDKVTGLVWERNNNFGTFTQSQAGDYCANKGSGWRLPTVGELFSLVDFARTPTIDPAFGNTFSDEFWTSSPVPRSAESVWYVDFLNGTVDEIDGRNAFRVRCVRR